MTTEQKDFSCFYAASLGQMTAYVQVLTRMLRILHPDGLPKWADQIVKDAESLVQEVLKEI